MSLLESIQLEHLPASHTIHIALFQNVKNAAFLHQQLLSGNTDFEYALIDASVILSRVHILAAAYRAINDLLETRLRSRNVHSEIVFSLSPNNNIATSFRTFGILPSPPTPNLLILKLSTPSSPFTASQIQSHLSAVIEGEQIAFTDENLARFTDLGRVRKVYKMNGNGNGNGGGNRRGKDKREGNGGEMGEEKEIERRELEVLVLGAMALRGSTN